MSQLIQLEQPILLHSGLVQPFGLDFAIHMQRGLGILRSVANRTDVPDEAELERRAKKAKHLHRMVLGVDLAGRTKVMPIPAGDEEIPNSGGSTSPKMEGAAKQYMIAKLCIEGTLTHKEGLCSYILGGTSYEGLTAQADECEQLVAAGELDGVLGDVNSPGGMVYGGMDCCDRLYRLRDVCATLGIIRDEACSGGMLLASGFERLVATQSADAGHIGVYRLYQNHMKALADAGVEINAIYAGEYKLSGAYWLPFTKTDRKMAQEDVDYSYGLFTNKVARNRGMSVQEVVNTKARIYRGPKAVGSKLIDQITTYDGALSQLARMIDERRGSKKSSSMARPSSSADNNKRGGKPQEKSMNRAFAAVALALAASPHGGEGASLIQLASTVDGSPVAVFEKDGKSLMMAYTTTGDLEKEDGEVAATLHGDAIAVAGYAPIPADHKMESPLVGQLAAAQKQLGEEKTARGLVEKTVVDRSLAYAKTLGQLGTIRGRLTPALRDQQVGEVTKAFAKSPADGAAALKLLEDRVEKGASVIPGQARDIQPPGSTADSSKPDQAGGSMNLESFKGLSWTERGKLAKEQPEMYERMMAQMPGADLRAKAVEARKDAEANQ